MATKGGGGRSGKKFVKVWWGGWVSGAQILRFFPTYFRGGSGKKSVKVWWGGWVSGAQILRIFPIYFGIFSEGKSLLFEQFQPMFYIFASDFAFFGFFPLKI